MNRVISIAVLAALNFSFVSSAAALPSRRTSLEQAVGAFEKAYVARDLGSLDRLSRMCAKGRRQVLCRGKFKIQMEHSLGQDDRVEYISFDSFAAAEKWLRKSERSSGGAFFPVRSLKPRQQCQSGLCAYNFDDGISHNNLYLKSIRYKFTNFRDADDYYITEVHLLNGD
jgi:hypothetical protein